MLLHNVDTFMEFFSHLNLKIIGRLLQLQYDVKKLALLENMVIVCTMLIEIKKMQFYVLILFYAVYNIKCLVTRFLYIFVNVKVSHTFS